MIRLSTSGAFVDQKLAIIRDKCTNAEIYRDEKKETNKSSKAKP